MYTVKIALCLSLLSDDALRTQRAASVGDAPIPSGDPDARAGAWDIGITLR